MDPQSLHACSSLTCHADRHDQALSSLTTMHAAPRCLTPGVARTPARRLTWLRVVPCRLSGQGWACRAASCAWPCSMAFTVSGAACCARASAKLRFSMSSTCSFGIVAEARLAVLLVAGWQCSLLLLQVLKLEKARQEKVYMYGL